MVVGRCGSLLWVVPRLGNYRRRQRDTLLELKKHVYCFTSNTEHNFILQKVQFQARVGVNSVSKRRKNIRLFLKAITLQTKTFHIFNRFSGYSQLPLDSKLESLRLPLVSRFLNSIPQSVHNSIPNTTPHSVSNSIPNSRNRYPRFKYDLGNS